MVDKRRLWMVVVIAAAVIVILVAGLVWAVTRPSPPAQASGSASVSSAPGSPSPVATEPQLTFKEKQLVKNAGVVAAEFGNYAARAITTEDYLKAGFSDSLAKSYKPIWSGLVAGRDDQKGAWISAQADAGDDAVKLLSWSGSQAGSHTFRVAVKVAWQPQGFTYAPGKDLNWRATTNLTDYGRATWVLTYDELADRIVKVEQPAWQDLGAEPLYSALDMPVPTKQIKG